MQVIITAVLRLPQGKHIAPKPSASVYRMKYIALNYVQYIAFAVRQTFPSLSDQIINSVKQGKMCGVIDIKEAFKGKLSSFSVIECCYKY